MQVSIKETGDLVSPSLAKLAAGVRDRRPILSAMGGVVVNMARRSFTNPALRAAAWPKKKDGSKATLRKTGSLKKSIRVVRTTNNQVIVGTSRNYAAIHQLGGKTKAHVIRPRKKKALAWPGGPGPRASVNHPGSKIPARPFFPFRKSKASPALKKALDRAIRTRLDTLAGASR